MIRIDSVLPGEKRLAEFIAAEIRSMGLEPELHEVAPGRPNVYACTEPGDAPPRLVFSGHSDTVPPAPDWNTDPFEPVERRGKLYGLGASNMKGGLACMLAAFKALAGERVRVGLAVTVDQEGLSTGAHALLETGFGKCDAMLHAEHFHGDSENDYLPNAVTGKLLYRLTVRGRAAHAFRPEEGGLNAVEDAARIIAALDRLKRKSHPLFGKGTVCTLKAGGGYREYSIVVPDRCEVVITRLLVPGETRESAIEDMEELIDTLDLGSSVVIETPPPGYDAYALDEDAGIMAPFKEAYRNVIGKPPFFAGHHGVVDANVFTAKGGIPTVVFGPKGANHHMAGEYVVIDTLEPTSRVYAECALRYLSRH
jgi:acetylornithine deacetylase/succinyl-diaminopimelate desuccinylase-like protein